MCKCVLSFVGLIWTEYTQSRRKVDDDGGDKCNHGGGMVLIVSCDKIVCVCGV